MQKFSPSLESINCNNNSVNYLYSTFECFQNYFLENELFEIHEYIIK